MTLAEFLVATEEMFRQTGRTSALAEASLQINGIFLVHTLDFKQQLEYRYPELHVESLYSRKNLLGIRKPLIFDHLATYSLLQENNREVQKMRMELRNSSNEFEINMLKTQLRKKDSIIDGLEEKIEDLQEELDNLK